MNLPPLVHSPEQAEELLVEPIEVRRKFPSRAEGLGNQATQDSSSWAVFTEANESATALSEEDRSDPDAG